MRDKNNMFFCVCICGGTMNGVCGKKRTATHSPVAGMWVAVCGRLPIWFIRLVYSVIVISDDVVVL